MTKDFLDEIVAERGEQAQRRLRESQRELGRVKEAARARDMGHSLGIGM